MHFGARSTIAATHTRLSNDRRPEVMQQPDNQKEIRVALRREAPKLTAHLRLRRLGSEDAFKPLRVERQSGAYHGTAYPAKMRVSVGLRFKVPRPVPPSWL